MDKQNGQEAVKEWPIVAFWHKHNKEIKIVTGVLGFLGAVVLTVCGVKHYWNATAFERWFEKASLDDLKAARDNIHSEYLGHTVNDEYRESLWNLLPKFDRRISELQWAGKKPSGPAYHREHGFNLYKPD